MHILVATDADYVVNDITAALGGPDVSFTIVREGRAVAAVVNERTPDLCILDLQIGSKGAMAVAMDLRLDASAGRSPDVKVLMLLDRQADVHLAKRSAADAWLVKPYNPLTLQRAVRDVMTDHCGVVRSEDGLAAGLGKLDEIDAATSAIEIRTDIAGFDDLAHAFDLDGSLLAARATLESARERRESRGCHVRADIPEQDERLLVNLTWRPGGAGLEHEPIGSAPDAVRVLADGPDLEVAGRLLE